MASTLRVEKDDIDFMNDLLMNSKMECFVFKTKRGTWHINDWYLNKIWLKQDTLELLFDEMCLELSCITKKQLDRFNKLKEKMIGEK